MKLFKRKDGNPPPVVQSVAPVAVAPVCPRPLSCLNRSGGCVKRIDMLSDLALSIHINTSTQCGDCNALERGVKDEDVFLYRCDLVALQQG